MVQPRIRYFWYFDELHNSRWGSSSLWYFDVLTWMEGIRCAFQGEEWQKSQLFAVKSYLEKDRETAWMKVCSIIRNCTDKRKLFRTFPVCKCCQAGKRIEFCSDHKRAFTEDNWAKVGTFFRMAHWPISLEKIGKQKKEPESIRAPFSSFPIWEFDMGQKFTTRRVCAMRTETRSI